MSLKKFEDFKNEEIKVELDNTDTLNESSIDYDILNKIEKLPRFNKLREDFRKAVDEFTNCVENECDEFDEGDTDHDMSLNAAIQSALDAVSGY